MEKSNIEKDNLNNLKNSSNIKKNVNKNKKHIGFNIQNKICVTLDINSNKFCTKCNSVQVYFQLKQMKL